MAEYIRDIEDRNARLRKALEQAKYDVCEGCRRGWPIDSIQQPIGEWHVTDGNYVGCRGLKFKATLRGEGE